MYVPPLDRAIDLIGLGSLSKSLGVTYQAIRKWQKAGRMPRTEWTGETSYSDKIQELTLGQVLKEELLALWNPPPEPADGAHITKPRQGTPA